jgi:hypothetical protein
LRQDYGPDVEGALINYLSDVGLDRAHDVGVLRLVRTLNDRIRAAQDLAAAWRGAQNQHHATTTTFSPARAHHNHAATVHPAVSMNSAPAPPLQTVVEEAIYAVEECYSDLPRDLQVLFGLEDSFACVYSPTGAIECSEK